MVAGETVFWQERANMLEVLSIRAALCTWAVYIFFVLVFVKYRLTLCWLNVGRRCSAGGGAHDGLGPLHAQSLDWVVLRGSPARCTVGAWGGVHSLT